MWQSWPSANAVNIDHLMHGQQTPMCDVIWCDVVRSSDVVRYDEFQRHALAIDHLVHSEAGELQAGKASRGRVDCHLNSRRSRCK